MADADSRAKGSKAKTPETAAAAGAKSADPEKKGERLHKFLAYTGAGSRRECETFIAQGRVTVNGKTVTKMGVKVDPANDVVTLDGEKVRSQERVYYLLNKPPNYICTNSDERGRPRVVELIEDRTNRIYTVGRLDADSMGLILLTNDGEIANIVCHPRYRIEKVYQVVVRGHVTRDQITRVEAGVWLAEGKSSPARVRPVARNPRRNETPCGSSSARASDR
ncbi:MAG: pseudouridine synthase [Planctomycetota bacterium]|jgi:23S rRNA pseudouridine2605 synthase